MTFNKELVESIPEGRRNIHNWVQDIPADNLEGVRTELLAIVKHWWSKHDTTPGEDFLCNQATSSLGWIDVRRTS